MKKFSRIKSPYLSIYKPQQSSVISILERLSGIYSFLYLIIFTFVIMDLADIWLSSYTFYFILFYCFLGNTFCSYILFIIFICSLVYHMYFIPLILKRYKAIYGEVNNYHISKKNETSLWLFQLGLLILFVIFEIYQNI